MDGIHPVLYGLLAFEADYFVILILFGQHDFETCHKVVALYLGIGWCDNHGGDFIERERVHKTVDILILIEGKGLTIENEEDGL